MNAQAFAQAFPRVTRATVDEWLAANRPNRASYESNGAKGIYSTDIGPAHSFVSLGATWREVLQVLTIDEE